MYSLSFFTNRKIELLRNLVICAQNDVCLSVASVIIFEKIGISLTSSYTMCTARYLLFEFHLIITLREGK